MTHYGVFFAKDGKVEYWIGRDERGHCFAEFSMGQEAIGRWLNEELGEDLPRIDRLCEAIARLQRGEIGFHGFVGPPCAYRPRQMSGPPGGA